MGTAGRASLHPRLNLRGVNILVVEDHDDLREGFCALIRIFGATVRGARNGAEALASVAELTPALILCDLTMPGMDGFALIERLHQDPALSRVPVLAVSGYDSDEAVMRSWEAGFSAHLVKPLGFDVIAAQLARFLPAHQVDGSD